MAPSGAEEEDGAAGDEAAAVGLPVGIWGTEAGHGGHHLNRVGLACHWRGGGTRYSAMGILQPIAGLAVGEAVAVAEVVDGVAVQVAAVAAGAGAEARPAFVAGPDTEAVGAAAAEGAGAGVFAAVRGRDAAQLGIAADEGQQIDVHRDLSCELSCWCVLSLALLAFGRLGAIGCGTAA